jgi:hypothetical protein
MMFIVTTIVFFAVFVFTVFIFTTAFGTTVVFTTSVFVVDKVYEKVNKREKRFLK